ncbi:MAG: ISL3 family transposase [Chloroflexota bacterium]
MKTNTLPISIPECDIEKIETTIEQVTIQASLRRRPSPCPKCNELSNQVHGYYQRTIKDLPILSSIVWLKLRVRRFRCQNATCSQQTFTQQVNEFLQPYQRSTNRLKTTLSHIGQFLGGRAGARLAMKLSMPISGDTLLRLVRRFPEEPLGLLRVIGIDDWAVRKGQRYGTIIVDLEKHRVVDLLPDRDSETVEAWLSQHPTLQIITRDRSKEYAQGITAGAPQAKQVVDRWHLLKNMYEVVERSLHTLYPILRERLANIAETNHLSINRLRDTFPRGLSHEAIRQDRRAERRHKYELVHFMSARGLSTRRIAKIMGISRGTVFRFLHAETYPEVKSRGYRPSILDPYLPYLEERVQDGHWHARQLWEEIVQQGYPGTKSQVIKWLTWRKKHPATIPVEELANLTPVFLLPPVKELLSLLAQEHDRLTIDEDWLLSRLMKIPEISAVQDLVQSFLKMIQDKKPDALQPWLAKCRELEIPYLNRFAKSLTQDFDAIQAALESPWSNGQVEGQVNRLKLLKRQMYGRAKLDLLKKRIVYQP